MIRHADIPHLPQRYLEFATVSAHKLEILVKRWDEDKLFEISLDILTVIEEIVECSSGIDVFEDLFVQYSFKKPNNNLHILELLFDR